MSNINIKVKKMNTNKNITVMFLKLKSLKNYYPNPNVWTGKKSVLNYLLATVFILISFSGNVMAQSAGCNIELKVEKDRNVRSTPSNGTFYAMVITNNGRSSDNLSLTSSDVNATCTNTDGSSTAKNVVVNVEFLDSNQKPISSISVAPGETKNFFAHIIVPNNTSADRWSCTAIVAKSKNCPSYKTDTVLHTLVINSNEDK